MEISSLYLDCRWDEGINISLAKRCIRKLRYQDVVRRTNVGFVRLPWGWDELFSLLLSGAETSSL